MTDSSLNIGMSYGTFYTINAEMDKLAKQDGNRIGTLSGGRGKAVYDRNNTLLTYMFVFDSDKDGEYDTFTHSSNGLFYYGKLDEERKVDTISSALYKAEDKNGNGIIDDGEIKKNVDNKIRYTKLRRVHRFDAPF